jgi:DNA-binding MarR family transcriptional regulator
VDNKESSKQAALRFLASQFENLNVNELEAYFSIIGVSAKVVLQVEEFLSTFDINRARFSPLAMLFTSSNKQLKPSELADHAGVTRATMTGMLDGLAAQGLVERKHDPEDRRALFITLTPEGEKLIRKVLPLYFKKVSKIMAGVTDAERRALASILRKIERNVSEE